MSGVERVGTMRPQAGSSGVGTQLKSSRVCRLRFVTSERIVKLYLSSAAGMVSRDNNKKNMI